MAFGSTHCIGVSIGSAVFSNAGLLLAHGSEERDMAFSKQHDETFSFGGASFSDCTGSYPNFLWFIEVMAQAAEAGPERPPSKKAKKVF